MQLAQDREPLNVRRETTQRLVRSAKRERIVSLLPDDKTRGCSGQSSSLAKPTVFIACFVLCLSVFPVVLWLKF